MNQEAEKSVFFSPIYRRQQQRCGGPRRRSVESSAGKGAGRTSGRTPNSRPLVSDASIAGPFIHGGAGSG